MKNPEVFRHNSLLQLLNWGTREAPVQAELLFQELRMLNMYLHEELWKRTEIFFSALHALFTHLLQSVS